MKFTTLIALFAVSAEALELKSKHRGLAQTKSAMKNKLNAKTTQGGNGWASVSIDGNATPASIVTYGV